MPMGSTVLKHVGQAPVERQVALTENLLTARVWSSLPLISAKIVKTPLKRYTKIENPRSKTAKNIQAS